MLQKCRYQVINFFLLCQIQQIASMIVGFFSMIRLLILTFTRLFRKGERIMSNKNNINKSTTYLTNLEWKKDIYEDLNGKENRELAKERLIYLFESMQNILLHDGEQKISGNMDIDYPVKIMIRQILTMRKEPDINLDRQIAKMKLKDNKISSQEIANRITEMGKKIGASGVRQREGWKHPDKFLTDQQILTNVDSDNQNLSETTKWEF